jgi:GTP-binding protein LepA
MVPILNKVSPLPPSPNKVRKQIEDVIGIDASDAVMIGPRPARVPACWKPSCARLPPPRGATARATLKALLVDAGTTSISASSCSFIVVGSVMKKGSHVMMGTNAAYR